MTFPGGYAARPPRLDEAAAVAALMTVADADSGEEWVAADVEREWRSLDLAQDVWVVEARDGSLAGYVETAKRGDDRLASDGYVHPDHLGRGVGRGLLELVEQHARELVGRGYVSSVTLASNPAAVALFEGRGYAAVRHFFRMVIDLDEQPEAPQWPEGLAPRPFDRAHAREFHGATEEAFAEEFGHHPETFDEWCERRLDAPFSNPELWLGVWDGDEIAATLICDEERFGLAWVGSVGVRKPWRRRGVGLALLQHAFGEFWRRGRRRVGLGVDAENPTGATRLYERAGMHVAFDAVMFEKEIA